MDDLWGLAVKEFAKPAERPLMADAYRCGADPKGAASCRDVEAHHVDASHNFCLAPWKLREEPPGPVAVGDAG